MKTVSAELKARVDRRINECVEIMQRAYPNHTFSAPHVAYNINSARLGGQAIGTRQIRLNPVFLNTYTDHYITQTIGHEMAHILVKQLHVRFVQPHGSEWKHVMRVLGIPANRCHSYEVPEGIQVGKRVNMHPYKCSHCEANIEVGAKVHNKIQRGANYWHRKCGRNIGMLVPTNKAPVATAVATKLPTPTIPRTTPHLTLPVGLNDMASKLDRCRAIMHNNSTMRRQDMIRAFALHGGCTLAGAATYYYKLKESK
jgi:SprT protein